MDALVRSNTFSDSRKTAVAKMEDRLIMLVDLKSLFGIGYVPLIED